MVGFVAWTLAVWVGRIRNIWSDEDLDTAGQLGRSLLALSFVLGAVLVVVAVWRAAPATLLKVVGAVAVWTAAVWVVRSVDIVIGDWGVGFKLVHSALAMVSIALAAAAFNECRAGRERVDSALKVAHSRMRPPWVSRSTS